MKLILKDNEIKTMMNREIGLRLYNKTGFRIGLITIGIINGLVGLAVIEMKNSENLYNIASYISFSLYIILFFYFKNPIGFLKNTGNFILYIVINSIISFFAGFIIGFIYEVINQTTIN